jgi:hypothetical protein
MYTKGLGLSIIGRFEAHQGFDGVMLGHPGGPYHLEFTVCHSHPIVPAPTPEDLLVLYIPDKPQWEDTCKSMEEAGFNSCTSFNPWWDQQGRTFEDADGYRVVLQQGLWISSNHESE